MAVEVNTREFQFSHGKMPRGTGYWGFEINGQQFWHTGSYAEAKRMAIAYAVTKKAHEVKVLP